METTILAQCLDLTKSLKALGSSFNINIKLENSHIRFTSTDEGEKAKKKTKSPSQRERDSKRKRVHLESKDKVDKFKCPKEAEHDKVVAKQKVHEVTIVESDVSTFLDNLLKPKVPATNKYSEAKGKNKKENQKCQSCRFRERSDVDLKKHNEIQHKEQNHTTTEVKAAVGSSLTVDSQMETSKGHLLPWWLGF